jgi:hypothetical protein
VRNEEGHCFYCSANFVSTIGSTRQRQFAGGREVGSGMGGGGMLQARLTSEVQTILAGKI